MKSLNKIGLFFAGVMVLTSCNDDFSWIAEHETPRAEYAPNMYYSEAYEPMSQITNEDAGAWVDSDSDPYGEYYNSNPYNRYPENSYTPMTMRDPAPNTVKRGYMPYLIPKDSVEASKKMKNPIPLTDAVLKDGEVLYLRYCGHCHGQGGAGDGLVNNAFKGVANLTSETSRQFSEGYLFHVITYGVRRMWPHGSQINQDERWKIVHYVKNVVQKTEPAQ